MEGLYIYIALFYIDFECHFTYIICILYTSTSPVFFLYRMVFKGECATEFWLYTLDNVYAFNNI